MMGIVPNNHLTIGEAIWILANILGAGTEFSEAVRQARNFGVDSVFDRKHMDKAREFFWNAVNEEKLKIYAEDPRTGKLLRITNFVLNQVPCLRKVNSFAYLRESNVVFTLLAERFGTQVRNIQLLVREEELAVVSRALRRTRRRKEGQRSHGPSRPVGRPNQRQQVKEAIVALVDAKKWISTRSLKELTNLIRRSPVKLAISNRTVERALHELHGETRDPRYQRLKKAARGSRKMGLPHGAF